MIIDEIRELRAERAKAISHHPELANRYHVLRQEAGQEVSSRLAEYADFATVYSVYVWVHKAVRVWCDAVMWLDVRVVDKDDEALDAHPLTELLGYVNDTMAPPYLWGAYTMHKLLGGESFMQIVSGAGAKKPPVELWPRRPDRVAVLPDTGRKMYPAAAGYKIEGIDDELAADEMIHDRFQNPLSDWRGLPPIAAARAGITIDIFAQAWSRSFLKRGARPDWALIAPEGLTDTERQGYLDKIEDKYAGHENWHKPFVLEKGVTDIKVLSFPPKDIQWLEQRKFNRDEVGGLFCVPDEIMGYGRDTYENFGAAHSWFWRMYVVPFVKARDTTLTSFFTKTRPMLEPGERVATDLSEIPALQEDITEKAEAAKTFWSMGIPANRIDERMSLGFGPVPGGDVGYVPYMVMPVGSQGVAGQLSMGKWLAKQAVPEYGSPRHKALWKAAVARWSPYERRMADQLKSDFEKQRKAVRAALAGEGGKQEQEPRIPSEASEFFDAEEWAAWFAAAYEALYADAFRAVGQATLAGFGMDAVFDIGRPDVQRAIRSMRMKFADDVNGETLRMLDGALRDLLDEAAEQGWGVHQIQEELGKRTDDVFGLRKELWQRERIARTEMHKAAETADSEAALQTGLALFKGWLCALDGRERETHREAHMRYREAPIPAEVMFEVGTDMMREPGTGTQPEENINCRCTKIWIPVEGA